MKYSCSAQFLLPKFGIQNIMLGFVLISGLESSIKFENLYAILFDCISMNNE